MVYSSSVLLGGILTRLADTIENRVRLTVYLVATSAINLN